MELTHSFTVPASVENAWAAFNDLDRIAPCFPGASLSSYDGESFTGACKVKVGPISLQYTGSGKFLARDEAAHRAVVEAKGKDRRGNGTATAKVTASLEAAEEHLTRVTVQTDLAITGKPAQFGRGVMQDVGDKLLGQFANCLERKLANGQADAGGQPGEGQPADGAAAEGRVGAAAADEAGPAPAANADGASADAAAAVTASAAASGMAGAAAPAAAALAADSGQAAHVDRPSAGTAPTGAPGQAEVTPGDADQESGKHRAARVPSGSPVEDFAEPAELDLGATVLPILARRYAPFLGAALLLLVLLRVLVRRRH
ncbi:MAG TPA: SRPBCC family protein [Nocardioidaceae bacterium]|nr:SRPBCC family protein [Nocardioidaceae bacterium]